MNSSPDDVNSEYPRERLAVFVHGFGSSAACWSHLLKLLRADTEIAGSFRLVTFEYPTTWFNANPLTRIPRLLEIGRSLAAFLDQQDLRRYREVTLVGHSQGGLVIQSYLVDKLRSGFEDLDRIRQVILIATPNLGSTLFSPARKLLSTILPNPQERSLRVLNPEIAENLGLITERIVAGRPGDPQACPIPIRCFWGMQDQIVEEASARGPFDSELATPLTGNHFTILQPDDKTDERYRELADGLLNPRGHRSVFEIDLYEIKIEAKPLPAMQTFEFKHGDGSISVQTDNIADVTLSYKVSEYNRCKELLPLHYGTRQRGYIKAEMSHDNEASPQNQQAYEDTRESVVFAVRPDKGQTYQLFVTVYNGFGAGNRNLHTHLVPADKRMFYKNIRIRLDLSGYISAGWAVKDDPACHFFPQNVKHDQFCTQRKLTEPLPFKSKGLSGWTWELGTVQKGVVDVVWDVIRS